MGSSIFVLLLVQVILIALNAIFAGAEIAVLSVNDAKLERMAAQGNKKARRLQKLTAEPARFLSTIQIAITLSGFLGSAFAADGFSEPLVNWVIGLGVTLPRKTLEKTAVIIITLILSYFTLIFGELVPKRIAMKKSEALALAMSGLLSGISALFKPVVWLLSVSTNGVLRLCGIDPHEEDEAVSEEEIRIMVDEGGEKGTIDREEQKLIRNVFEFDDLTAGEIATHRTDVDILLTEDDDESWASEIHDSRHTLYPVCDGSPDKVIGIVNAKDYFRLDDKSRESVLQNAMREPYFVPESIKADVLFKNMKRERRKMAVVLDEYGGMAGIITLNDLVGELVGDFEGSEDDVEGIEKLGEGRYLLRGNIALRELEEATGVSFDTEDSDTFTGAAFEALGMVLGDGVYDMSLNLPGASARILKVEGHKIVEAELIIQ